MSGPLKAVAQAIVSTGQLTTEGVQILQRLADPNGDGIIKAGKLKEFKAIIDDFSKLERKGRFNIDGDAARMLRQIVSGDAKDNALLGRVKIAYFHHHELTQQLFIDVMAPMGCQVECRVSKLEPGEVHLVIGSKGKTKAHGAMKDKETNLKIDIEDNWFNKFRCQVYIDDPAGNTLKGPLEIWSFAD